APACDLVETVEVDHHVRYGPARQGVCERERLLRLFVSGTGEAIRPQSPVLECGMTLQAAAQYVERAPLVSAEVLRDRTAEHEDREDLLGVLCAQLGDHALARAQ